MQKPNTNHKSAWERDRKFQLCVPHLCFPKQDHFERPSIYACVIFYPRRTPLETNMPANLECSYRSLVAKWKWWEGILEMTVPWN